MYSVMFIIGNKLLCSIFHKLCASLCKFSVTNTYMYVIITYQVPTGKESAITCFSPKIWLISMEICFPILSLAVVTQ